MLDARSRRGERITPVVGHDITAQYQQQSGEVQGEPGNGTRPPVEQLGVPTPTTTRRGCPSRGEDSTAGLRRFIGIGF
jgi:hypothetical protein